MFDTDWNDDDLNLDDIFGTDTSQTDLRDPKPALTTSVKTSSLPRQQIQQPPSQHLLSQRQPLRSQPSQFRTSPKRQQPLPSQSLNFDSGSELKGPGSASISLFRRLREENASNGSSKDQTRASKDTESTLRSSTRVQADFNSSSNHHASTTTGDSSFNRPPAPAKHPLQSQQHLPHPNHISALAQNRSQNLNERPRPPPQHQPSTNDIRPGPSVPKRSASPPARRRKKVRSRFPGPAGRLAVAEDDPGGEDGEEEEQPQKKTIEASGSSDVEMECRHTYNCLVTSLASSSSSFTTDVRQLLSDADVSWLSRDLLFGSTLPSERVPLLAVSIESVDVGHNQTTLGLRDLDGNAINGIVINADTDEELVDKLVQGSSILLKDAPAGYVGHALVSHYVVVTEAILARICYFDSETGEVKIHVSSSVEVLDSDWGRLEEVYRKSIAVIENGVSDIATNRPPPSLFATEFDSRPPSAGPPGQGGGRFGASESFERAERAGRPNGVRDINDNVRKRVSEEIPADSTPQTVTKGRFNFSTRGKGTEASTGSTNMSSKPSSTKAFAPPSSSNDLDFDFGCDSDDDEAFSQLIDKGY